MLLNENLDLVLGWGDLPWLDATEFFLKIQKLKKKFKIFLSRS
jgi:hypothetical protein